jgi:pimeloyl-ACP methyl ester carboxylesterase
MFDVRRATLRAGRAAWRAALFVMLTTAACRRDCPPVTPASDEPPSPVAVTGVDGSKVDVEHHDGLFNGLTIHYVTAGPANGKKVLLLHGFPEFWYGWRYQIAALAKNGYRVYAPDLRGFDRSSKPEGKENYTIAKVADDVVAMIRSISPSQKITLVGHDWGGSAAWRIAYDHGDLIDKLFILNIPHPNQIKDVQKAPLSHLREAIGMLYIGAFKPKGQPEFIFKDLLGFEGSFDLFVYNPMVHKEHTTEADRKIIFASWGRPGVLTAASNYYRVNFDFPSTFPDEALPRQLPVVLVFGLKDMFMSPSYAERLAKCTTCAENLTLYRIEDASHFVHSDVPGKVNDILLKHIP